MANIKYHYQEITKRKKMTETLAERTGRIAGELRESLSKKRHLAKLTIAYLKATEDAGKAVWGIVIQFPFYAGILGLFKYTMLSTVFTNAFVAISTPQTFPLFLYWYGGLLNYLIPSGGGQFAVEAPYILPAAKQLGIGMGSTVITFAWSDMMTDMIQPFWAIPLLGVAKLSFRDIMGYCMVYFLIYMVLISIGFEIEMAPDEVTVLFSFGFEAHLDEGFGENASRHVFRLHLVSTPGNW
jgi:hypothetical protein